MSEHPFITGLIVDRSETKIRRNSTTLRYALTFEYADRSPVHTATEDVQWMVKVLDELGVSAAAATLILQRGGYVARIQPK
jgi:hypothetical protein